MLKYYIEEHGEDLEDARCLPPDIRKLEYGNAEDFAEDVAAYLHWHDCGWEWPWPIVITVVFEDNSYVRMSVELNTLPLFDAQEVE